jgi:hypothetical protein
MLIVTDKQPEAGVSPFLGSMGFGGTAVIRIGSEGTSPRLVAKTEPTPACVVNGKSSAAIVPLCTGSMLSVRADGGGVVVVTFSGVTLSPARVHSIGASGDTIFTYVLAARPTAIPRTKIDSLLLPLRGDPRYSAQVIAPRYYAPVRRVIAGADGSVWLEEYHSTTAHQWLVLDPKGRPVGRVSVPEAVHVMQATVGKFWGVTLDADDVPTIVRYRVR